MKLVYILAFVAPFFSPAQGNGAINTPGPMLSPAFSKCEQFKRAVAGDSCYSMSMDNSVTLKEFLRLNPGLKGKQGCESNRMLEGYWYCVKALGLKGKNPPNKHKPTKTATKTSKPSRTTSKPSKTTSKPPKKTSKPTKTTKPKPTKTTEKPKTTSSFDPWTQVPCDWGSCWKGWMQISTWSETYVFTSATNSCKRMSKMPKCTDVQREDLPKELKSGCDTCEKITSGCSCMLEEKYHTYTKGFTLSEERTMTSGNWLDPNMKKRGLPAATPTMEPQTMATQTMEKDDCED